jgi:hypothetical protein
MLCSCHNRAKQEQCVLVQREMELRLIGVTPKSVSKMVVLESLDPNARIYRILANPEGKDASTC